ncbi:MAG: hypothetical protein M3Y24_07680 [Acidobacteriota bacterium]|nr:hypothetical protein [Acidobacteriota bacterium]
MAVIPFLALFPLTLAYVLIVQRAMDIRILLRMGTKYLATLHVTRSGDWRRSFRQPAFHSFDDAAPTA